ncbi:MAG: hypothetical protein KDA22_15970, partial [Phycisphaerales bacterium]|nr:hypothetical protein [Phycisphaerales bacterium]
MQDRNHAKQAVIAALAVATCGVAAAADVTITKYYDYDEWSKQLDSDPVIVDFVLNQEIDIVTHQYAPHGVLFTDGNDIAVGPSDNFTDKWGLVSFQWQPGRDLNGITVKLSEPTTAIAANIPSLVIYYLYADGEQIGWEFLTVPCCGDPLFAGIVSSEPFDTVVLEGISTLTIDDLIVPELPPFLEGDLDGDGVVGGADLGILLSGWGWPNPGDLDDNGVVDGADLGILLSLWTA